MGPGIEALVQLAKKGHRKGGPHADRLSWRDLVAGYNVAFRRTLRLGDSHRAHVAIDVPGDGARLLKGDRS